MQEDIGHASASDMVCEAILGAHDCMRQGRHIIDPYRAEARTLAMKNSLMKKLKQLPEAELWEWMKAAAEFKQDFRRNVGNMRKQKISRYIWGLENKEDARAKRRKHVADSEALAAHRGQLAEGDMHPDDGRIMGMSTEDLKARLYMWRSAKPGFKGPPIFTEGKAPWLGGSKAELQMRLKKVVAYWPAVATEGPAFTWVDASVGESAEFLAISDEYGEHEEYDEASDSEDEDGQGAVMFEGMKGLCASASF